MGKRRIDKIKVVGTLILLISSIPIYADELEENYQDSKLSFGFNIAGGVCADYSYMYKNFKRDYNGITPPKNLICVDLTLCGMYFGIGMGSEGTGYDVYGYDEQLTTTVYKFGLSFNLKNNKSKNWRYTFTPYVGRITYSLSDTSQNDIGARDEYGTKESSFLVGCKLAAIYKDFCFGIHCSNKELGFSLGFEYDFN